MARSLTASGFRRTAALAALAALAGCSHARVSTPQAALPSTFEAGAAADAGVGAQALDRWWMLFNDPQLADLIEGALVQAPDARSALQRIEESRALRDQALSRYRLQGNLTGLTQVQRNEQDFGGAGLGLGGVGGGVGTGTGGTGIGGTGTGGTTGAFLTPGGTIYTTGATFNVTYELDLFGRRRLAARSADADLAANRFDYEATRAVLARDVATSLFQARGYAIQLADARETERIAGELSRVARLSAERGLTSTSSAARLETELGNAQAEVVRLEALSRSARRTLLALVGRGAEPLDALVVQAAAAAPPAPPVTAPGELLRRRPDIRREEARLRAISATLELDKLALWPTFTLAPGVQFSRSTGAFDVTSTVLTAGGNVLLPVFDRPRLQAVIRADRARGEQAVIAYEQAVQNAYRDAENGLQALAADRARVERLTGSVARARFAFDASRKGYELGLLDLNTLLDSERSWRQARATLTAAQITALSDAATLFQALGGGWTPP